MNIQLQNKCVFLPQVSHVTLIVGVCVQATRAKIKLEQHMCFRKGFFIECEATYQDKEN